MRKVLSHRSHHAYRREEAGSDAEVRCRAAQRPIRLAVHRLDAIKKHRTDD
jgi:hypothetical protein